MRGVTLIAVLLLGCGGDAVPGETDAMVCTDGLCNDTDPTSPATAADLGEWVLAVTYIAPPPGIDAGPSLIDAGTIDAGGCPVTIEIRVCVWDGRNAEILIEGRRAMASIGVGGGGAIPHLGPVTVAGWSICGLHLYEEGGLSLRAESCGCDGQYLTEAATHDPLGCPSFP